MREEIAVIKVGGSVIFNKDANLRVSPTKQLFEALSEIVMRKILVVGCGEILHQLTYQYNLTDKPEIKGTAETEKRIEGFFKLYQIIEKNLLAISCLVPKKLSKPTPIHPIRLFVKKSKGSAKSHEIVWFNRKLFERTQYPLTSGGIVFDTNILFSAISSDTIATYLAMLYKVNKMILISNVDGVYDKFPRGKLLKKVNLNKIENLKIDGGMKDKLRRIKPAVDQKISILLINGNYPQRVYEALVEGETEICTKILS